MKPLFGLLAVITVYRFASSRCDCPGLRRRLACAHRETKDYRLLALGAIQELERIRGTRP